MKSSRLHVFAYLTAGMALLAIGIWNGFPVVYFDTDWYLDPFVEAGQKSAFYRALLRGCGHFASLWLAAALQAGATLFLLRATARILNLDPDRAPHLSLLLVVALVLLTTLPWEVSYLMPDIFSGLLPLAIFALIFGENLKTWEKATSLALLSLCLTVHNSHLPIALFALAWAALFEASRRRLVAQAPKVGGAIAAAITVTLLLNFQQTGALFLSSNTYPVLTNRFLEAGLVQKLLAEHCAQKAYALCPFAEGMSTEREFFLHRTHPKTDSPLVYQFGGWRKSASALRPVLLDILRYYPAEVMRISAKESLRQLRSFEIANFVFSFPGDSTMTQRIASVNTNDSMLYAGSRQAQDRLACPRWVYLHQLVVILALLYLGWWLVKKRTTDRETSLVGLVLAVFLANAVLCGSVSHAEPRYGARVCWLLPFAAGLVALPRSRSRKRR